MYEVYGCVRVYNYVCNIEYTDPPQLLLHCFVLHRHTVYFIMEQLYGF